MYKVRHDSSIKVFNCNRRHFAATLQFPLSIFALVLCAFRKAYNLSQLSYHKFLIMKTIFRLSLIVDLVD